MLCSPLLNVPPELSKRLEIIANTGTMVEVFILSIQLVTIALHLTSTLFEGYDCAHLYSRGYLSGAVPTQEI